VSELCQCFGVVSALCFGVFCEIINKDAGCFGVSASAPRFSSFANFASFAVKILYGLDVV